MENSVPPLPSMWRSQCLLGTYFSFTLSPAPNGVTLCPQDRRRGPSRKSTFCCISPVLCGLCSSSPAFYLSDLAFGSLPDIFPAEQGWFLWLSKNVLFFVLVNKQKNRAYLVMYFCVCVCVRRETKEGNTKFELPAYINYVSESTPDTS